MQLLGFQRRHLLPKFLLRRRLKRSKSLQRQRYVLTKTLLSMYIFFTSFNNLTSFSLPRNLWLPRRKRDTWRLSNRTPTVTFPQLQQNLQRGPRDHKRLVMRLLSLLQRLPISRWRRLPLHMSFTLTANHYKCSDLLRAGTRVLRQKIER